MIQLQDASYGAAPLGQGDMAAAAAAAAAVAATAVAAAVGDVACVVLSRLLPQDDEVCLTGKTGQV